MNHFIYEIDERKLKILFKGMEDPLSESAWEEFQKSHKQEAKPTSLALPELNLNRSIVLGIGFFILVVGLSFGIYKIIQIQPGGAAKNSVLPVVQSDTTDVDVHSTPPSPSTVTPQAPLSTNTVLPQNSVQPQPTLAAQNQAPPEVQPPTPEVVDTPKKVEPEKTNLSSQNDKKVARKDSSSTKKKKSKKKNEPIPLETEVLQDIRPLPPPPSEEQEIKLE